MVPLRVCRVCGLNAYTDEDLEQFAKCKRAPHGRLTLCLICNRKYKKEQYEKNRDQILKAQKKYRDANPGEAKARSRKHYVANREKILQYQKIYAKENKEKINRRLKKWRLKNRERLIEIKRKYREDNPEKIREYTRNYTEKNRERINKNKREYWKTRRENAPFNVWASQAKSRATRKGLSFNLDQEYIELLWDECGGICPMTGIQMILKPTEINHPYNKSLDRINPERGYVKGNVRIVSFWYNMARSNGGDAFTREMCQRVIEHERT